MSNGHIFISYRRDDSAGYTRAIYDKLAQRFTEERIFMDVDAIEPGLPFDEVINQAVSRCKVLIVMIGKRWMEQQPGVGPRINDEKDFVRIEIAAALSRGIRVIPVLLDGASMPTEEELPEPLRLFARRHAIEISNNRFNSDVDILVEIVRHVLRKPPIPPLYWLLGGLAALILLFFAAFFVRRHDGDIKVVTPTPSGQQEPAVSSYSPSPTATPPSTTGAVSNLCKELGGKSIFIKVNYHGVVGLNGIKLVEMESGRFKFETEVMFRGPRAVEDFGKSIRDPIVGECEGDSIIMDRTLQDKTNQHLAGKIYKADTGRIEMRGSIENGSSSWSGWIDTAGLHGPEP